MACGQCSSGSCGSIGSSSSDKTAVSGCGSGGCATSGCNKINSFDWLSNMTFGLPSFQVVEIKFKGGRKEYFINKYQIDLYTGDFVVCEMPSGYHIGHVSLQGDIVRLQLLKKGISDTSELKIIHRLATEKDLEKHTQAINRDLPTMYRTREICKELKLNLKLSEVEYQSDNSKATFYYSSDDRVDFRDLIKRLASEFKVRVEMRQISLRQEAGRIGGIGSCGRELCCSTWLTEFKPIPTAAARYQNLSLNPAKLSGQCGRLKCCLNYELETYIDAIRGIPAVDQALKTEKGNATLQKTDIFRRIMWFSYPNDTNWYPIGCDQVVEIQKMNADGKKPLGLENLIEMNEFAQAKPVSINNDLEQLDNKYLQKRTKKKPRNPVKPNSPSSEIPRGNQPKSVNQPKTGNQPKPENQPKPGSQPKPKVDLTNKNTEGNISPIAKESDKPNKSNKRRKYRGNKPKPGGNTTA